MRQNLCSNQITHRMLHSLQIQMFALCVVGLISFFWITPSGIYAQGGAPNTPLIPEMTNVEVESYTAGVIKGGGASIELTLQRPKGWIAHNDGQSLVLEPSPNLGDVGVLFLVSGPKDVGSLGGLSTPEGAVSFLAALTAKLTEERREIVNIGGKSATLLSLRGQFSSERAARFLLLHLSLSEELHLVVIAGASDVVFDPYRALLRDILLSIQAHAG